jgi:flagellin
MRINTNISSLTAQENAINTNNNIKSSLEKLSSGLRINKASDDASGLAIADKLRTQATSINQGVDNGTSAVTLLQIADKSMAEQSNILDTIKAKLIQANTDTTSDAGREAIRKDINKLLEQLDNIAKQTNYNGNTLLQSGYTDQDGSAELNFQIGENKDDIISGTSVRSNTVGLGGGTEDIDQTSGSATRNNQIAGGTSIVISTDGTNTASLDAQNASGTSTVTNVNLSGQIGTLSASGTSLTITSVDAKTAAALDALIADTAADGSGTEVVSGVGTLTSTGTLTKTENADGTTTYTLASGGSLSFGSTYSVASMDVEETSASGTVTVGGTTAASNLTVTNNGTDSVNVTSSGTMTGGQTLSGLKNLGEGELTKEKADEYQTVVDAAIGSLNTMRSNIGSTQNQVESAVRNLMTQATNVKAAESIIRDVDYAQESSNFNKQNIISQAGAYAISQANSTQQNVLRLLQ